MVCRLWLMACTTIKCFSLEEATILLDLAAKSGNISRTVSAMMKFIPSVSARGIVELENVEETVS